MVYLGGIESLKLQIKTCFVRFRNCDKKELLHKLNFAKNLINHISYYRQ